MVFNAGTACTVDPPCSRPRSARCARDRAASRAAAPSSRYRALRCEFVPLAEVDDPCPSVLDQKRLSAPNRSENVNLRAACASMPRHAQRRRSGRRWHSGALGIGGRRRRNERPVVGQRFVVCARGRTLASELRRPAGRRNAMPRVPTHEAGSALAFVQLSMSWTAGDRDSETVLQSSFDGELDNRRYDHLSYGVTAVTCPAMTRRADLSKPRRRGAGVASACVAISSAVRIARRAQPCQSACCASCVACPWISVRGVSSGGVRTRGAVERKPETSETRAGSLEAWLRSASPARSVQRHYGRRVLPVAPAAAVDVDEQRVRERQRRDAVLAEVAVGELREVGVGARLQAVAAAPGRAAARRRRCPSPSRRPRCRPGRGR